MRRIATTLAAAGAFAALALPGSAFAAFGPTGSFGGTGSGLGQFNHPEGVVVDPGSGNIYVADTGNSRLEGLTSDGTSASAVTSGRSGFKPVDVAIGPGGNQWTVSPGRVDEFALGNAIGGFTTVANAAGIAVDGSGNVYVSDSANGKIHVYNSLLGVETSSFGTQGSGPGDMLHPMGLTTDAAGNLYVADPDNGRIDKFTGKGVSLGSFSMPVYLGAIQGIVYPHDVAVDSGGRVYAPDASPGGNVVAVFASNGSLQQLFGSPSTDPSNPCQMRTPWGVAAVAGGGLLVSSTGEDLLRKFSEAATACPAPDFGSAQVSTGTSGGAKGGEGGGGSAGANGASGRPPKPQIRLVGLPHNCARQNFSFQIQVTDDGVIKALELLVNGRTAARQHPDQGDWNVKVRMPVTAVRKQLPRGAKVKITIEVKVRDDTGTKAHLTKAFKICG